MRTLLLDFLFGTNRGRQHVHNVGINVVNTTKNVTAASWSTCTDYRPVPHSTYVILINVIHVIRVILHVILRIATSKFCLCHSPPTGHQI